MIVLETGEKERWECVYLKMKQVNSYPSPEHVPMVYNDQLVQHCLNSGLGGVVLNRSYIEGKVLDDKGM
jgi:hypothetical protein